MGQRRRAREYALQMLFQLDLTDSGTDLDEIFAQFWEGQEALATTREFSQRLVRGTHDARAETDRMIRESAANWKLERMAVVDRNVLRLAVWELLNEPGTPAAVIIDEAIEVAKRFGSEESGSFINGVLDAVRRQLGTDARGAGEELS